jgi:hypothetical protein
VFIINRMVMQTSPVRLSDALDWCSVTLSACSLELANQVHTDRSFFPGGRNRMKPSCRRQSLTGYYPVAHLEIAYFLADFNNADAIVA